MTGRRRPKEKATDRSPVQGPHGNRASVCARGLSLLTPNRGGGDKQRAELCFGGRGCTPGRSWTAPGNGAVCMINPIRLRSTTRPVYQGIRPSPLYSTTGEMAELQTTELYIWRPGTAPERPRDGPGQPKEGPRAGSASGTCEWGAQVHGVRACEGQWTGESGATSCTKRRGHGRGWPPSWG